MSEQEPWVVVWAVPKHPLDAPCWLMVCLLYTSDAADE